MESAALSPLLAMARALGISSLAEPQYMWIAPRDMHAVACRLGGARNSTGPVDWKACHNGGRRLQQRAQVQLDLELRLRRSATAQRVLSAQLARPYRVAVGAAAGVALPRILDAFAE